MSERQHLDIGLYTRTLRHVIAAIESAAFQSDPFPHTLVHDFFPSDVYSSLLENIPPSDTFEPFSYEKHSNADGDSNRKRFSLENTCLDKLGQSQHVFWHAIRCVLGSTELKEAVYHKLRSGLSYRYGCKENKASSLSGYALPELFHETKGYHIKPHPDTRKKVVTMQIALPEDEGKKNLGTEFYRRSINPADWLRAPKGFTIVKTMPFIPNTAYAFVVLNTLGLKSWHGRSALDESSGVRNSLLNIWYEKAEHGNQEILSSNELLNPLARAA
jgi:hypothetical protein